MQQRHILWLIGAAGILVLIAFLSGAFNNDFSQIDVPELNIASDEIEHLTIISAGAESDIALVRDQGGWRLTRPIEALADSIALDRLTGNLGVLELESVVSTNPDRYENYGVGDQASRVMVGTADAEQTLIVGNPGPDYRSIFLRLENDPRVFATNGRLNLPADLDAWRDKTVLNLSVAQIEKVEVQSPAGAYSVNRAGSGWYIQEGGGMIEADSASVVRWLDRFTPLKGTGFMDTTLLQEEATHVLTFSFRDNTTRTFWLKAAENQLTGAVSGQDYVASLSTNMLPMYVPESNTLTASL